MAKRQWRPKRIRSEDERRTGSSGFIRLAEGESFLGYALFDADPKKNDPGYYEYRMHWVPSANRSVPCADEDCPLCEEGDKPKEVANTLWLVLEDENGNKLGKGGDGELRTFRANSLLIKQFTELRGENEKIKGRLWRVKRVSEKGDYMLMPKTQKLAATEVKGLVISDDAPDYDQMVTSQLNRMMEGIALAHAMDDTTDDYEEADRVAPRTAKGGKGKGKGKKAGNPWPEEGAEEFVTVVSADEENFLMVTSTEYDGKAKLWGTPDVDVTEYGEGDEIYVEWFTDDEDDFVLADEPTQEEAEEEGEDEAEEETEEEGEEETDELPDEIEGETLEVVGVDDASSTMDVKSDDLGLEFTLYFLDQGPASEIDFDDYKPGAKIKVSAEKDSMGDLIATEVPTLIKPRTRKTGTTKTAKTAKTSGNSNKRDTAKRATAKRASTPKRSTRKRGT